MALGSLALANVPLTTVSEDPFTNTTAYHQTEVEPDTFAWGSTIVSVFQTGRYPDGGSDDIGWATTTNGGTSWTNGFLPGITSFSNPAGPYARVSDPSVAYDPKHDVWLALSLTVDSKNTAIVNRSTDGGLTWNPVVVSAHRRERLRQDVDHLRHVVGQPQLRHLLHDVGRLRPRRHHDAQPVHRRREALDARHRGRRARPGRPAGGTAERERRRALLGRRRPIQSLVSTDGGKTYSGPYTISTQTDHGVVGLRTEPLPSAELDKKGNVYVVWQDCRFRSGCSANDIVMSTSKNGTAWSATVRIPIDAAGSTVDHFIPGIGVDPPRRARRRIWG